MKKILSILCFAIGAFLFFKAYGIMTEDVSPEKLLSEGELVSGELVTKAPAVDYDFKVKCDGPILIRKVEMYQYTKNGWGGVTKEYSSQKLGNVTIEDSDGNEKVYRNPSFPEDLQNTVFYGDVTIGEDGPTVSDELLEKLSYGSYVDFESPNKHYRLKDLPPGGGNAFGLEYKDNYYVTGGSDHLGSLRVSFYALDMSQYDKFTIWGQIDENNVIGETSRGWENFYDRVLTPEELVQEVGKTNKIGAIGFFITGAIFILIGAVWFRKRKKVVNKDNVESVTVGSAGPVPPVPPQSTPEDPVNFGDNGDNRL